MPHTQKEISNLRTRLDGFVAEQDALLEKHGPTVAQWDEGPATRFERLDTAIGRIRTEIETAIEERTANIDAIRTAAQDSSNVHAASTGLEDGTLRNVPTRTKTNRVNPWRDLGDTITRADTPDGLRARAIDAIEVLDDVPHEGRELLAGLVDQPHERNAAELILAGSDPAYRSAFEKILADPVNGNLMWAAEEQLAYQRTQASRAALSLNPGNGGYLVPFTLDPTIILTNAGAANPFRTISRHATTTTNTWNGASSAGVTAQWLGEGAVVTDNTPTFGQITITPQKAAAFVFGSYEILGDSDVGEQLPRLLLDAQANLENIAFSTGSGTGGIPKGIVTAATTTVSTASVGTFAVADVYALQQALLPRARNGKTPAMVGNVTLINKLRQFDTAGGASYWTNLGEGAPAKVLGLQLAEASGMASTITTGSKILVAGDFDKYQIVDRLGMTVLYNPMLLDQATGRPTGQGGWFAYWRTGADVLDASAFRTLVVQ